MPPPPDPTAVKAVSEQIITRLGGKTLDWLPWLDREEPRSQDEAVTRTLIMNAMLQIAFNAPIAIIRDWIAKNGLTGGLSQREREVLGKTNAELTEQEQADLDWYIEPLWTLAWAGSLVDAIPIDIPVGDELATLMPNLQKNEDGADLARRYRLRPFEELYRALDLYYRAHWYARDGALNGYDTGVFDLDVIMERRKALEWLNDRTIDDWDETPDHT